MTPWDEYYKPNVIFLISTKAELITNKVNKWLDENRDKKIVRITPYMSNAGDKGYMIGCMIEYINKEDKDEE